MSGPNLGALTAGQVFHGRYEIVRRIKAGGMGAVYECVHINTRKHRALKVMLPQILADAGMRERFELEARVTAPIESEHIVETFDAGVDDATGAPFLVMELLRGEDLGAILKRRGPLPPAEVMLLLSQAALALDKTHAAGIVHRDLKPDNLFVTTRDDGSLRLKILDFGIAKVVADGSRTVQQTAALGTPLYMSQEQIRGLGTIGPRADVYALGHIAFALLTGAAYWHPELKESSSPYTFLENVMAGPPEPATARAAKRGVALPPAFDVWFARATAASASDRFEHVSTLVDALAQALGTSSSRSATTASSESERALLAAPAVVPASMPPPTEAITRVAASRTVGAPARSWQRSALAVVVTGTVLGIALLLSLRLRPGSRSPLGAVQAGTVAADSVPVPAPEAPASVVPAETAQAQAASADAPPTKTPPPPPPMPPFPSGRTPVKATGPGKVAAPPQTAAAASPAPKPAATSLDREFK